MRAYNASASLDAPLRGPAGQIDPPLPNTPRLISLATEADLNALNAHVGPLPMYNNNATVDVRRQLLADFLGIVV
ncbi:hypothetical protein VNI00_003567 [Paramarasmius palmivorus]|uniref:Uncharacterized protein n=1 Tax=Paramarasmius palmivorus TaxID=297713 RepID=A0AAW0DS15_9AGAR